MPKAIDVADLIQKNKLSLFLAVLGILFLYYYLFVFSQGPDAEIAEPVNSTHDQYTALMKADSKPPASVRAAAMKISSESRSEPQLAELDERIMEIADSLTGKNQFAAPRKLFEKPSMLSSHKGPAENKSSLSYSQSSDPEEKEIKLSISYVGFYSFDGEDFAIVKVSDPTSGTGHKRLTVKRGSLIPSSRVWVMGVDSAALSLKTVQDAFSIKINETGVVTFFEKNAN